MGRPRKQLHVDVNETNDISSDDHLMQEHINDHSPQSLNSHPQKFSSDQTSLTAIAMQKIISRALYSDDATCYQEKNYRLNRSVNRSSMEEKTDVQNANMDFEENRTFAQNEFVENNNSSSEVYSRNSFESENTLSFQYKAEENMDTIPPKASSYTISSIDCPLSKNITYDHHCNSKMSMNNNAQSYHNYKINDEFNPYNNRNDGIFPCQEMDSPSNDFRCNELIAPNFGSYTPQEIDFLYLSSAKKRGRHRQSRKWPRNEKWEEVFPLEIARGRYRERSPIGAMDIAKEYRQTEIEETCDTRSHTQNALDLSRNKDTKSMQEFKVNSDRECNLLHLKKNATLLTTQNKISNPEECSELMTSSRYPTKERNYMTKGPQTNTKPHSVS